MPSTRRSVVPLTPVVISSTGTPPGGATAAGAWITWPPSACQALHEPFQLMRQISWSSPTAYAVTWLLAVEDAVNPLVNPPPWLSQPDQDVPSHARCHMPMTGLRTNTSMRWGAQETAPGSAVTAPPSDCQGDHDLPSQPMCQRALSLLRANTSSRFGAQDATVGAV